jgi:uncharacterized membrane protein YfcA
MSLAALYPDVPWYVAVVIPLTIFGAYVVFGATGFGSSIISVPMLAHWFPLTFAVPLVTLIDCVSAGSASIRQRQHASYAECRRVIPAMLIGIAAGATLLVNLPRSAALFALGVFVSCYGVYLLIGQRQVRAMRSFWAWPIGIVGGVFSVLFGTGGPLYMIYLSARIHDKTALRATSSLIVAVSVFIRAGVFAVTGLVLNAPLLVAFALLLPLMFAGFYLGNRAHFALSRAGVLKLIAGLLALNGVSLIVRASAMLRGE